MNRPKVFISNYMPASGLNAIKQYCDVDYNDGINLVKQEFINRAKEADALVIFMTDCIDAEVISKCPRLKVIASFGKGYDNIDVAECAKRNIVVTINPDNLTASTADLAIGLLLAACRNILISDQHIRCKDFDGWHPFNYLGTDFHHSTLGIIGFGAIGQAIARRAKGFDVKILYYDIEIKPEAEKSYAAEYVELPRLLAESDFVVLAVNLKSDSYHVLGANELNLLKKGSYLINVARGSLVDEQAVAVAIKDGILKGYAADVFEFEDRMFVNRPDYINDGLLTDIEKTVFTPHLGTGTIEARQILAVSTAKQLLAALRGEEPSGRIV
ncbi:Phosphonate dehydrogenase [bioreactor metagenome]|uniref:Phosphonate dehydrogenase n=1 Tax=bioreactor metagenome TaxID=1076179 RepID=A0A645ACP1_9ZZZZ